MTHHQAHASVSRPRARHTDPRWSNALVRRPAAITAGVLLGVAAMTIRTTLTQQGASAQRETP
jgi:uncharacterized membrane protein YdfJ with MMPL/SSD domain